jgi:hypothetical protein
MTCAWCGAPIIGRSARGSACHGFGRYCSTSCRVQAYKRRRRAAVPGPGAGERAAVPGPADPSGYQDIPRAATAAVDVTGQ